IMSNIMMPATQSSRRLSQSVAACRARILLMSASWYCSTPAPHGAGGCSLSSRLRVAVPGVPFSVPLVEHGVGLGLLFEAELRVVLAPQRELEAVAARIEEVDRLCRRVVDRADIADAIFFEAANAIHQRILVLHLERQ